MPSHITDRMLTRQIHHLTQHLPKKEELEGLRAGSSYYRKVNDDSFCHAFKRSHQQLNGLRTKYELTHEQMSFITEAQMRLIDAIKEAYSSSKMLPHFMQHFLSMCDEKRDE